LFTQRRRGYVKAVVYQGPYEVTVERVPDPEIEAPNDAIIRLTTTNICASDLHRYEGRMGAEPDPVLGVTRGGGR
jgi:glutathione-independent formaldehyde dehydrogenase